MPARPASHVSPTQPCKVVRHEMFREEEVTVSDRRRRLATTAAPPCATGDGELPRRRARGRRLGHRHRAVRLDYPDKALELGTAIFGGLTRSDRRSSSAAPEADAAGSSVQDRRHTRRRLCPETYSAIRGSSTTQMNVLCIGSNIVGPSSPPSSSGLLGALFDGGERLWKTQKVALWKMQRAMATRNRTCTS